ncbi:response regulator [Lacrimispora sp. NSJ-141]|uniref:Stage 0 sporulation protein A homolog n=1 Tax=Lientehia hominis TaxID=2897778 RepID=A0AAP2RLL4_9FIRM|nr:response regulator [Lientehia hominis]MCD2493365.1 response regulator [Lientehia hominis]
MIKLAVVEDESFVRKCLVHTIPWQDQGCCVIFEAADGKEALARLEEGLIPDIIISDICMPDLSGLELLEHLHCLYPDIRLIFISGHDNFEYAQKAVNLGASSYLLKPVEPEELTAAVRKASMSLVPASQKREFLIHTLLNGTLTMEMAEQSQELLHELNHAFYGAVSINFFNSKKTQFLYKDFFSYLSRHEDSVIRLCMLPYFMQFLILEKDERSADRLCRETVDFMEKSIQELYGPEYIITVSDICHGPNSIFLSTSSSVNMLNLRSIFPDKHVFRSAQSYPVPYEDYAAWSHIESLLVEAVLNGNHYKLNSTLDMAFRQLSLQPSPVSNVYYFVRSLLHTLGERLSAEGVDFQKLLNEAPEKTGFSASASLPQMRLRLGELLTYITEQLLRQPALNVDALILKAKRYIDGHLNDPNLCLSETARHVHLNPSYFSSLFSTRCGDTFINYVNRKRVDYAKLRLTVSDRKIAAIGEEAGYLNTSYFSTVFKKYSGHSPSEYRAMFTKP